ncbi:MAG: nucleotidyl transferase AbiEii/AbiGii toxin family protein [Candidatus Delongbacteria bacterium]|jgi:predicted nucleotidyltransferase component of viral defense system
MEKKIDYVKLYEIQDKILEIVFSFDNSFYLTGGTALHRFHYNYRYSDDLDFFVPGDDLYGEYLKEFCDKLSSENILYKRPVQTRDFSRFIIKDFLQVDFVNDRVYREGNSERINGFRIDNILNILTNKISAILSRDEEKDIFDLFSIAYNMDFNWHEVLSIVNKKSHCEPEILAQRIKNFPIEWLDRIKRTEINLTVLENDLEKMCKEITEKRHNSLAGIK